MKLNDEEENGDEAKEDEGVNDNGEATDLHGAELHHPIPSGKLKQQPRREQHEQHHRDHHRPPIPRHRSAHPQTVLVYI